MHKKLLILCIILGMSLAVNFTLGGMVLGRGMMPPPLPHHARFNPVERMEHKIGLLPSEHQEAIRQILENYRPQLTEAMAQVKATRKANLAYLKSEDYQRAEAETRFADLRKQSIALQKLAQAMLLEMADILPPEHRALLMKRPKMLSPMMPR